MSKIMKMSGAAAVAVILTMPSSLFAQRTGRSDVTIWAQTCANCHTSQPRSKYESVKWESIMTHMQLTARLTRSETQAILRYLKRRARTEKPAVGSESQPAATDGGSATEGVRSKDPAAGKNKPPRKVGPPHSPAR